jgi:hypothetical protein
LDQQNRDSSNSASGFRKMGYQVENSNWRNCLFWCLQLLKGILSFMGTTKLRCKSQKKLFSVFTPSLLKQKTITNEKVSGILKRF